MSSTKKEPFKKIASVFAISALSTIPAAIIETIGNVVLVLVLSFLSVDLDSTFGLAIYYLLNYVLIVGLVEELCKFFTFKWMIFHDRQFDNTYDGLVYGAASALGFATLENILYVFTEENSLQVALLRAVLSIPMHAVTGILMGYCFGISKYRKYNNIPSDDKPEIKALVFSILLHGIYDFTATLDIIFDGAEIVEIILLIVIMAFIYFLLVRTILNAKKDMHNIYNRYYYEQLGGAYQDMFGGKTTSERRMFFGVPLPMNYRRQPNAFNPYNPYANVPEPANQYQNYQQPYNSNPTYNYQQSVQNPQPQYTYNNTQYVPNQQYANQQRQYTANSQAVYSPIPKQNKLNQSGTVQSIPVNPSVTAYPNPTPKNQAPSQVTTAVPMKICPNCGAKQPLQSKYCSICGNKMPLPDDN